MKIYSIIDTPERIPTPEGNEWINTYQEVIGKTGKKELKLTGQKNVYDMIQVDAESCKIENILHQVAMGDLAALHQRDASYIDATTMPQNLMDAQNLVIKMKDEFYKMPLEVRQKFDNSPEMYVSEMGTNAFIEKMAPYNEKIEAISKEKSAKEYEEKVLKGAQLNIDIERKTAELKGGKTE